MTSTGRRGELRALIAAGTTGARPWAIALVVAISAGTALAYALRLPQSVDNAISDSSFAILAIVVVGVAAVRSHRSRGLTRAAWGTLAITFGTMIALVLSEPNPQTGDLPLFLDLAIIPAVGFWMAVLALTAPAIPGIASLRTAADALWVGAATVIAIWPWTIDPLLAVEGRSAIAGASHLAFAVGSITLGSTVLVITPFTAGRGRIALWMFGLGGATASIAGVFHIRFFYEGTLRFGSWWDYLWTLGVGLLALAGLLTVDDELQPRQRSVRWYLGITVAPLVFAGVGIAAIESDTTKFNAAAVLLLLLAVRVIVLLIENDRLARRLTSEASHDPLTGLANRRSLQTDFVRLGALALARSRQRAFVLLDLDRFKEINDTHGHLVGDEVLKSVASDLGEAVRDDDVLVRHGGDEFVVIMLVRNRREVEQITGRLREAVLRSYDQYDGNRGVGVTMGVAIDDGLADFDRVLARADAALYQAKEFNRGTIEIAFTNRAGSDASAY